MPSICHICDLSISRLFPSLSCSICFSCYHSTCLGLSIDTITKYNKPSNNWICYKYLTNMSSTPINTSSSNSAKQSKKPLTIDDLAKLNNTLSSDQNKSSQSINTRIDDIKTHLSNLDSALVECVKLNV